MPRLTVVISQGQSANPAKRKLEEDLVSELLFEKGVEVTVIPHLYDLDPNGTGMLCLQGISGDMVVMSWLFPRAAHWILDRQGIKGLIGPSLLKAAGEEDESDDADDAAGEDQDSAAADEASLPAVEKQRVGQRNVPKRSIYCLDLRAYTTPATFVEEVRRIVKEAAVKTVDLLGWIGGAPQPEQLQQYLHPIKNTSMPAPAEIQAHSAVPHGTAPDADNSAASDPAAQRIQETTNRRWYPVIDYTRCTNCLECIDFCLFGVYGIDKQETILIEQPDNCRKGCPACSRVCPENAIIFPQHKSPGIAGGNEVAGSLKIDLSLLFAGAATSGESAVDLAVKERDEQLLLAGRDAVGATIGMPKRQADKSDGPKDDLDNLMDQLDALDL
ncbi:MAG TPA: ferredoxin family protein [Pirellulales bacterium]|jgi:hypothetical protein|nr:ferredoxin family protein [Pirellulales bacterium]